MASSFVVAVGFQIADKMGHPVAAHWSLIATVVSTTIVWVTVAYVTTPTDRATLLAFYRLVRPAGPGWASVRAEAGVAASPDSLPLQLLGWVCGISFIYSALFGVGSFLYGRTSLAVFWTVVFVGTGIALVRLMPKLWKS